jgi:exodeoxyribonuclease V alpha subunit
VNHLTPPDATAPATTVEGTIERVTFHHPGSHFTIARFRVARQQNRITVLGYLPNPQPGEFLRIGGRWEDHPRYGQQLRITSVRSGIPASAESIQAALSSGVFQGVGSKTIARLVGHFREQTLEVMADRPERLAEVRGVGPKTASRLAAAWKSHNSLRQLMQYLYDSGINPAYGARLFREYGENALEILHRDPMRPAHDIAGIGFAISDRILQNRGTPADDPDRVQACVLHVLEQMADDGHIYCLLEDLLTRCRRRFDIEYRTARLAVTALVEAEQLVVEKLHGEPASQAVFLKQMHLAETAISAKLNALIDFPHRTAGPDREQITREILQKLAIQLSPEQLNVLEGVLACPVAIITGGPGTGKTTLIRSITTIFESFGRSVFLCAPTGRAAKRLSQVTRRDAFTIHRMLQYSPNENGFERNRDNPLAARVVIVDEASMVDTPLMQHLLDALQLTARLILVGDVHQLPSVGPGTVLSDLIASGSIPTFELKEIHRQATASAIISNAHRIRRGLQPQVEAFDASQDLSDFYFVEQMNPETAVRTVTDLSRYRIPQQFGFDPIRQTQVITPMHKGLLGTIHLNHMLQKSLNPNPFVMRTEGLDLKIGDKVMHLKNDYRKEVFNGDSGTIADVDVKNEMVTVNFDGRLVDYESFELTDLTLAYAITVHKSQGSEYGCVIIPLMPEHRIMLQRNLLYTAVTRGKQLVVIIGSRKAIQTALENDRPRRRSSSLAARLRQLRLS